MNIVVAYLIIACQFHVICFVDMFLHHLQVV